MYIVPFTRDTHLPTRLLDARLERFFAPLLARETAPASRTPALDLTESDTAYAVELELPGMTREDVKVSVEGRRVSIEARRERTEEKADATRVLHRERAVTSFARSFMLPAEVDQDGAAARLENGVLTLTLPKRAPRTVAQITIS